MESRKEERGLNREGEFYRKRCWSERRRERRIRMRADKERGGGGGEEKRGKRNCKNELEEVWSIRCNPPPPPPPH